MYIDRAQRRRRAHERELHARGASSTRRSRISRSSSRTASSPASSGCRAARRSRFGAMASGSTIRCAESFAGGGRSATTSSTSASPPAMFAGPEIVQASPAAAEAVSMDRAGFSTRCRPTCAPCPTPTSSACRRRRAQLVRARALERAQGATLSARNVSDFARFDRVEGLALGGGRLEAVRRRRVGDGVARGTASTITQVKGSVGVAMTRAERHGVSPVRDRATSAMWATSPSDRPR